MWVYANQRGSEYYPDKLAALSDDGLKKLHVRKADKQKTPGGTPGTVQQDPDAAPDEDKPKGGDKPASGGGDKPAGGDTPAGGDKPAAKDEPPKPQPKNDGPPPPAAAPPASGSPRLPVTAGGSLEVTGKAIAELYHHTERGHGGFFPLGDSGIFHCGAHLAAGMSAEVYAIADGDVVAARLGDGPGVHPWGDTGFVLLRHQLKVGGADKSVYSLFLHLKREPLHPDHTEALWLRRLLVDACAGEQKDKWRVKQALPTWKDDDKGKFSPTNVQNDVKLDPGVYEEDDQLFLDARHYVKLKGKWVRAPH